MLFRSTIAGGLSLSACMILIGSLYASHSVYGSYGAGRWVVIVMIYLFAIFFSITWAVGIKVYASEIQPPETRAAATSLAYSSNWVRPLLSHCNPLNTEMCDAKMHF